MKRIIKRALQYTIAKLGPHTWKAKKPELVVLMYHRILPADDKRTLSEEPGMIVTPETFRLHMNILRQYFDIVRLSDWLNHKNSNNKMPDRACVISFDDGWSDNYEFAYPILREMNIPATIFLVSDMIGTDRIFWPEYLARTISTISQCSPDLWPKSCLDWLRDASTSYDFGTSPPNQEELSELISHAKALPDHAIISLLDEINDELDLPTIRSKPSLLDWDQVTEMTSSGIFDAGSHTCNHVRLVDKSTPELLEKEIITSKEIIEKKIGKPVSTFCFPNGDYSPQALDIVKRNYECSVTTESGWNTYSTDNYLLRRISIHEDISGDEVSFLSRISGWI